MNSLRTHHRLEKHSKIIIEAAVCYVPTKKGDWSMEGYLILGLLAVVVVLVVFYYNALIRKRNYTEESWARIDSLLKRRYDLLPNLIETAKAVMKHERELFAEVTRLRAQAISGDRKTEMEANNMLTSALKTIFAVAENYPEIKSNQNLMLVKEELIATENKLDYARRHYNETVRVFNTAQQVFPGSIIASVFGFKIAAYYEVPEAEKANVKVNAGDFFN